MIRLALAVLAATSALTLALPAAASLAPTSYSMPNGDGQASGGTYNYWDKAYSGSGSTTTDGAALSGGLGDLTDGVLATDFWYLTENNAGTGPYVGWYHPATPNPVITFNFAGSVNITDIEIQMDNSYVGGVFAPGSIYVDGVLTPYIAPAIGSIGTVTLNNLNFTGSSHTIEFDQAPNLLGWTFVSEITFNGASSGAPEPAAWAMMIAGFGMAGAAMRRRRAVAG